MIKFTKVNIKYIKDYYSLFNINFEIDKNTILLGDETSGNNFVLRIISKIDKNYEGDVFIDGKNLKQIKDSELDLAYAPKEIYLFKNKSIFNNLYYPLKIRKIKKAEAEKIICELLTKFNIKDYFSASLNEKTKHKFLTLDDITFYKKVKAKNLTKTQQKVLMFLRAIVRKPKYVLCENLFTSIQNTNNEEYNNLTFNLLSKIIKNTNSIFILSEFSNPNLDNFNIISFDAGSIKK